MAAARIAICVPTFRREALLRKCLDCINGMRIPDGFERVLIVCDNDPDPGAADGVRQVAGDLPVCRVVEGVRGVVAVRNRLIEAALEANADWIAFFDDDSEPDRNWLVEALAAMIRHDVDVITGPVLYRLPRERPKSCVRWAYETQNRMIEHRAEGLTDMYVPAGAVMFRTRFVRPPLALRFDMAYNAMGGEDGDFFARLRQQGARVAWAAKAVTVEIVHPHRLLVSDYARRCFAEGVRTYAAQRREHPDARAALRYAGKSLLKTVDGAGCACGGLFSARCRCRALKHFARAAAYLAAPLGFGSQYYLADRTDGTPRREHT